MTLIYCYPYPLDSSSTIRADKSSFLKFSGIYESLYYFIDCLFCIWISCIIVS